MPSNRMQGAFERKKTQAKPIPIATNDEDLQLTLTVATLNFDVWWTYKQRWDRRRFLEVLRSTH